MAVYLFATLDTKGAEAGFVRDEIRRLGAECVVVDTGCVGAPAIVADVPREQVFRAASTTLGAMQSIGDRGAAVDNAAHGAAALAEEWAAEGKLSGIISIGGSAGTTIGTAAMRALPLGLPKVMVSTLASGSVGHFVGSKDILMLNSVVDILGLNRISRTVLARAAQAVVGMEREPLPVEQESRPTVAATMFGVTTTCIERARDVLEEAGFEVLVFHATGTGGRTMEALVADGLVEGVLDMTTTELADELVGGVLSAGPDRLTAASKQGIPQVVSVGATDMVNFLGPETVPGTFKGRTFHHHNENVTLMRTTESECAEIGSQIANKLSYATGPVVIMLPLKGVSAIDREGEPFDDPVAREALFERVRDEGADIPRIELDFHINDAEFAEAAANRLIALIRDENPS